MLSRGPCARDQPRHALPIQVLGSHSVWSAVFSADVAAVSLLAPLVVGHLFSLPATRWSSGFFGMQLAGLNKAGPLNPSCTLEPPGIFKNPDAQVTYWTNSIRLYGWDPGLPEGGHHAGKTESNCSEGKEKG